MCYAMPATPRELMKLTCDLFPTAQASRHRAAGRIPGSRRAFTLVELLIVIAILAVLVGLLLPAVNLVRDMAKSARCKSNVRQIGMAFFAYANDTGFYPDNTYSSTVYWNDLIQGYLEEDKDDVNA